MLRSIDAKNMIDSKNCTIKVDDKDITECPLCHKSFAPIPLFACVYKLDDSVTCASVVYFCRDCVSPFLLTIGFQMHLYTPMLLSITQLYFVMLSQ